MIQDTKKQTIINKLTLLDTSNYRIRKHHLIGKYKQEPRRYRTHLAEVYDKLEYDDLVRLWELKKDD